jgi:hypothetical protein
MSARYTANDAIMDRAAVQFAVLRAALRRYRFIIVQRECAPLILVNPH